MALALLEEGIGPDRISDMTTNIILKDLITYNHRVIEELKLETDDFTINGNTYKLLPNKYSKEIKPLILVPSDIVRDLPIASDWNDVSSAASQNADIRDKVNNHIGMIWASMTKEDKHKLKQSVMGNKKAFETLLELIHFTPKKPYNISDDINGEVSWGKQLQIADEYPYSLETYKGKFLNIDEVYNLVWDIIRQFKFLIEEKGLWNELWDTKITKPKHEKAAQRLFFAVADSYCKANDIDITPEAETGNGPVDFKASSGYTGRVLVELKLSTGNVVHGYSRQLEIYKSAERTEKAFYVIIDVGSLGNKYDDVIKIKNLQNTSGTEKSEIILIDALPKESASKRK